MHVRAAVIHPSSSQPTGGRLINLSVSLTYFFIAVGSASHFPGPLVSVFCLSSEQTRGVSSGSVKDTFWVEQRSFIVSASAHLQENVKNLIGF